MILDILGKSRISEDQALMLVFLLLFLPLMNFFVLWVRSGRKVSLRPIQAFSSIRHLFGRAVESGKPLHLSLGIRGVGGGETATTLAGIVVLDYLAEKAAIYDAPPFITVADPTLLPIAQDSLRRAYARQAYPEGYDPTRVRFIAPEPTAYAAGVIGAFEREGIEFNVMVGAFGDEYLLMGETGAKKGISQIVGTNDPGALSFAIASAEHVLIGEEIFASGAYLSSLHEHIGSLLAQDWMRLLIIAFIIIGVILKSV